MYNLPEKQMNAEDLNALHRNPENWRLCFFYYAPEDPRIVVRKRLGFLGWTLNFARPMAIPFLAGLIATGFGYMELVSRIGLSETGQWGGVFLMIVWIVSLCGWLSNPRRYTH